MTALHIPYETAKFKGANAKYNSGKRTRRSGSSLKAKTTTSYAYSTSTSWVELLLHAATVGDYSFPLGVNSQRPWIEFLWRRALIRSCLDEQNGYLVQSESYRRLDATEKGAASYFLGMTQASLLAARVLQMSPVSHVDDLLYWAYGNVPQQSRPDLIGYDPNGAGKLVLEAKGRSYEFDWGPIISAKCQVSDIPPRSCRCARCERRRKSGKTRKTAPKNLADKLMKGPDILRVASLSYFGEYTPPKTTGVTQPSTVPRVWQSYLEDPVVSDEYFDEANLSESQFRGLVLISQLMPIVRIIQSIEYEGEDFEGIRSETHGITSALLPDGETRIGVPTTLFNKLKGFEGHVVGNRSNLKHAESIDEDVNGLGAQDAKLEPEGDDWSTTALRSGVTLTTAPFKVVENRERIRPEDGI